MNRWLWAAFGVWVVDLLVLFTAGAHVDRWAYLGAVSIGWLLFAAGAPAVRLLAVTAALILGVQAAVLYVPPGQPAHVIWGPLSGTHHYARLSGGK